MWQTATTAEDSPDLLALVLATRARDGNRYADVGAARDIFASMAAPEPLPGIDAAGRAQSTASPIFPRTSAAGEFSTEESSSITGAVADIGAELCGVRTVLGVQRFRAGYGGRPLPYPEQRPTGRSRLAGRAIS